MASLSNEELPELAAEQHIQSEFTASDAEEETPVRELSAEFLTNSITVIMQIVDQAIYIDPNYEWRSTAWRGDTEMICCYWELLHERKLKKRKSTLDAYITKKPKFIEDPQPGPSSGLQWRLVTFI